VARLGEDGLDSCQELGLLEELTRFHVNVPLGEFTNVISTNPKFSKIDSFFNGVYSGRSHPHKIKSLFKIEGIE
jgi:hypothetical protein